MAVKSVMPGDAPYPRNAWYVAAFSHELSDEPMSRDLLGQPVVLYRNAEGKAVALFDRCPHRGYPLSAGKTCNGHVECGYHGLQFDDAGQCVLVPSGDPTPSRMRVRSFPVAEEWQFVWIWGGEPELADPALVPSMDLYGFSREGWFANPGAVLPVKANYLLPFENLLDATHISFLHEGQLDGGNVAGEEYDLIEQDGRIFVVRTMKSEKQAPLTMSAFGLKTDTADRTITAEAYPPHLCGIKVELTPDDGSDPIVSQLVVAITPQDDRRCLEFTASAANFVPQMPSPEEMAAMGAPPADSGDGDDADDGQDMGTALLMEDVVAMERIQALHDRLPRESLPEYGLASDKAAYRARRMIAEMLRADGDVESEVQIGDTAPDRLLVGEAATV